jgi:hypothetical protein
MRTPQTTKTIKLLAGATAVQIHVIYDQYTYLSFNCPVWKDKLCLYAILGN